MMTLKFIKFEFVTLRKRRQTFYIYLIFLSIIFKQKYQICAQLNNENNNMCGELKIFQQIWFSRHAITLSMQKTSNLTECITQCCIINSKKFFFNY